MHDWLDASTAVHVISQCVAVGHAKQGKIRDQDSCTKTWIADCGDSECRIFCMMNSITLNENKELHDHH